ncbi:MAG TPA: isoprenyl transferase [Mycobacteriales bacterium]|nr:isoprenyl transferase [Mycobacteriales bacterium]
MGLRDLVYGAYESRLAHQLAVSGQRAPETVPRHVGLIMDGNRRWARGAGVDTKQGHTKGGDKVADVVRWSSDAGVEVVTLWLLSTDNLSRASNELSTIFEVIERICADLSEPDAPWVVRPVGALDLLPDSTSRALKEAQASTAGKSGLTVNVAVGYGGRREITDAVRSLLMAAAERGASLQEVAATLDMDVIAEHLYTSGQPDPDLVIRTSGEQRLSGFLLWQTAHSEFYFCDALWPDFRRVDFLRALRSYAERHRRYGG